MENENLVWVADILTAAEGKRVPRDRTKRDKVLEKVLTRNVPDLAAALTLDGREAAADGVLDLGEFFRIVTTGGELLRRIADNIAAAKHFLTIGRYVSERDGIVCLCYLGSPCKKATWETCKICPKRVARFVPADFYHKIVEELSLSVRFADEIEGRRVLRRGEV